MQIDWQKFIEEGFQTKQEAKNAEKELRFHAYDSFPSSTDLHIRWKIKDGIKWFVLCCTCGNSRMTVHEKGIRCQSCGRFHNHDHFQSMREKVRKMARLEGGKIEKKPQPMLEMKNRWKLFFNQQLWRTSSLLRR